MKKRWILVLYCFLFGLSFLYLRSDLRVEIKLSPEMILTEKIVNNGILSRYIKFDEHPKLEIYYDNEWQEVSLTWSSRDVLNPPYRKLGRARITTFDVSDQLAHYNWQKIERMRWTRKITVRGQRQKVNLVYENDLQ